MLGQCIQRRCTLDSRRVGTVRTRSILISRRDALADDGGHFRLNWNMFFNTFIDIIELCFPAVAFVIKITPCSLPRGTYSCAAPPSVWSWVFLLLVREGFRCVLKYPESNNVCLCRGELGNVMMCSTRENPHMRPINPLVGGRAAKRHHQAARSFPRQRRLAGWRRERG